MTRATTPANWPGTTTYYWRIDEVNNVNPDSPWVGNVWSFTTAGFAVVDDFEAYDAGANQIWYSWHDGLGYGTPGAPPYFAGNGTGAAVGDENHGFLTRRKPSFTAAGSRCRSPTTTTSRASPSIPRRS